MIRRFVKYGFHSLCFFIVLFGLILAGSASAQSTAEFPKPYRMENWDMVTESAEISLNKSAGLPDGLSVAVQHRSRYETLDNSFRANSVGGDHVLSLRTLAQGELRLGSHFMFKAEMQDSRAKLVNPGTLLDTTMVNPAELLEANLQWNAENLLADGSKSILRAGRLTMDLGDRRLVARNRFDLPPELWTRS